MGIPDKANAAENSPPEEISRDIKIDDPPPAYTPYKTPADPKPPPLPSVPPVVTAEPRPATGPRIVRSPSPALTTDERNSQLCKNCKDICCTALRWSWFTCLSCTDNCIQMCYEKKPRRN